MVDGRKRARLDIALTQRKMTASRSQSESFIRLGKVTVDGRVINKPGHFVDANSDIKLLADVQYVSRAGLKLASVADILKLNFTGKIVLDVGSSTGGFTDYALRHGAKKVYAIDVGTEQLHPSLRGDKRIELHEKTDIRNVFVNATEINHLLPTTNYPLNDIPDIVVIDVSFISLRDILPHIHDNLSGDNTQIVAMVKPQFETHKSNPSINSGFRNSRTDENVLNKGIIKNDAMRRQILRDFEDWSKKYFVILAKRDSDVAGAKGNQERFYLLSRL